MKYSLNLFIDKYGTKRYYNDNNEFHKIDGPAIEFSDGTKYWYIHGQRHRMEGPAIEYFDGDKEWYILDFYISNIGFILIEYIYFYKYF